MSRCTISNPKKVNKIERLLGKKTVWIRYRGGHYDSRLGHFFTAVCSDGVEYYVSSNLKLFEASGNIWAPKGESGLYWTLPLGVAG